MQEIAEKLDTDIYLGSCGLLEVLYRESSKDYFVWHPKLWVIYPSESAILKSYEDQQTKNAIIKLITTHKRSLNKKIYNFSSLEGSKPLSTRIDFKVYAELKQRNINISKLINKLLNEYIENNS